MVGEASSRLEAYASMNEELLKITFSAQNPTLMSFIINGSALYLSEGATITKLMNQAIDPD
ncbi:hypothetical protein WSM22_27220 [Cytophagales bacterium WSM2-2]|nr:hypothetical protein WSM22_27220 [Cytophagales bacterium WSM2-2]